LLINTHPPNTGAVWYLRDYIWTTAIPVLSGIYRAGWAVKTILNVVGSTE